MKNLLVRISLLVFFLCILTVIIAFARGYRLDFQKKSFTSTGILAVSSSPKAAKVFVNDELKGVTDINLTLPPGRYHIEIKKDGYTSWKKDIVLKGELVTSADASLFPLNPSLSPLTNLGIVKAVPLDQTEKIILFSENDNEEKDGIYLFETAKKPLSLLPPLKPIILKKYFVNKDTLDFSKANVYFSPDYKQAIFEFPLPDETGESKPLAYLLSLEEENKVPFDVTFSKETLLEAWETEKNDDRRKIIEAFPREIAKVATDSFKILSFSPDETKILYSANTSLTLPLAIKPPQIATNQTVEVRDLKKDRVYVYDKKEDRNYEVTIQQNTTSSSLLWYPDSKHFVFIDGKNISTIDYDGLNKRIVYSGPFENSLFTTTGDGNIIVLTNLNPENNKLPDLYLIGIR